MNTFLSLLVSLVSRAEVNLKDGALIKTFQDSGISRIYNSRSLYKGFFGFGWCSSLEAKLNFSKDEKVQFEVCGKALRLFRSEKIEKKANQYVFQVQGKTVKKFDSLGRLIWFLSENGRPIRLYYRGDHLRSVVVGLSQKNKMSVEWNDEGFVKTFSGNEYFYQDQNLVKVQIKNTKPVVYSYDDLHNMISIQTPSSEDESFIYDSTKDILLTSLQGTKCREDYTYLPQSDDPMKHFIAIAEKKCRGQAPQKISHEFWFSSDRSGGIHLARTRSQQDSRIVEIQYEALTGMPISIRRSLSPVASVQN